MISVHPKPKILEINMLSEKYKNALNAFKAQGHASHLFEGCDVEAQHVYRIMMTELVSVKDMTEAMLEGFITQEKEGKVDYSKPVGHDGLKFVDITKDVEIRPYVGTGYQKPIDDEIYIMSSSDALAMLNQLSGMGQLKLITETMQSLSQRDDGTLLQTAFPELGEVKDAIERGLTLPQALLEKIEDWDKQGCSTLYFDFEETKENAVSAD